MSKEKKDFLKELKIVKQSDLRNYVLNSLLELSQSNEDKTRLQALSIMSRSLFSASGACILLSEDLEKESLY